LVSTDPIPGRVSYPLRLLLVFLMLPFHAFLGVTIMDSSIVLAGHWYESFHRAWGPTPLEDQHIGGGIMWAAGDVIAVVVLAALFVQWFAQSQREARREDRRLDRLEAQAALTANSGREADRSR
jgi:cytochrome c oxidase assembly factor CtaG